MDKIKRLFTNTQTPKAEKKHAKPQVKLEPTPIPYVNIFM
jgi:hypothetical protein